MPRPKDADPKTAQQAAREDKGDVWVFGYGSLMWRPGFAFEEARPAKLWGWRREFCILSYHYRGTEETPGLVLGLDRGGSCRGRAFRVAEHNRAEVLDYLDARELITNVYCPRFLAVDLLGEAGEPPQRVRAYSYVADAQHPQYAGGLALADKARLIAQGCGSGGPCRDYLDNTVAHLAEMGIEDYHLRALHRYVLML